MTTETAAKKDTQRLQRAIVDGLEDVKAQDIQIFSTEHLSALFERVVVASGTSNRQTKALAASVRDAVRESGFPKPRIEGEENGEWIIVDCGQAVVHIMQPAIRQYYHLEELWGEKPVRLRLGAPKPVLVKPVAPMPVAGARKPAAKKRATSPKPVAKAARRPAISDAGTAAAVPNRPRAAGPAMPSASVPAKERAKVAAKPTVKAAAKTSGKAASKPASKKPAVPRKAVAKKA